jgi:signal peptidase I
MVPGDTAPGRDTPEHDPKALPRAIVCLAISLLLIRTFLIEPSHVPTGSMAPHRLGLHIPVRCPECRFGFAVGLGPDGSPARPICPNCGLRTFPNLAGQPARPGDRLWISKADLAFRRPERWDEVVFYAPGSPFTPHLKRIAGLPGEKVRIVDGDIFADGVRVRKSREERQRMSVLVFDQDHQPPEGKRPDRWRFEVEKPVAAYPSTHWQPKRNPAGLPGFFLEPPERPADFEGSMPIDWLNYRHFCPILGDYGPVRDFLAYDGPDDGQGHVVGDLWFAARVKWQPNSDPNAAIEFRLTNAETEIRVTLQELVERKPGENWGAFLVRITIDGETIQERRISDRSTALMFAKFPGGHDVEMSWVDHRLEFRVAGELLFEPVEIDEKPPRRPDERFRDSPVGIGVRGSGAAVDSFRLYRDIHYTNRLATEPVIAHGVREDVELPPDGYFVLGDDSAHSVDSRFFEAGPAVPKSALIGRPIGQGRVP